ncbi:hypothetical protein AB0F77_39230 [Streptomyces sp. NPDC026672]|uniref:hypothetical protein n=1 Tax=unclassified Streptomyces TaxID=2593676 RepID=UPI0033E86EAD
MSFLIPLGVAVLIVVACTIVLVRRDRRLMAPSAEGLRIVAAATGEMRESRRRVRSYRNRYLRERD